MSHPFRFYPQPSYTIHQPAHLNWQQWQHLPMLQYADFYDAIKCDFIWKIIYSCTYENGNVCTIVSVVAKPYATTIHPFSLSAFLLNGSDNTHTDATLVLVNVMRCEYLHLLAKSVQWKKRTKTKETQKKVEEKTIENKRKKAFRKYVMCAVNRFYRRFPHIHIQTSFFFLILSLSLSNTQRTVYFWQYSYHHNHNVSRRIIIMLATWKCHLKW